MRLHASWLLVGSIGLLIGGCPEKTAPPTTDTPATPQPATEDLPDELPGAETATSSVSGKSDPLCVGPIDLKPTQKSEIAGWQVESTGYKLAFTGKDADVFNLGVLSDIKEDTGENIFNIRRYIAWYKEKNVDAIVVTGDIGETESAIVRVLSEIGEPGWPVFAIVGNREGATIFADALTTVQRTRPNVFNLNQRRLVQFPYLGFISLPGYHDIRFIHDENGCQYHSEDVTALEKLAKEVVGVSILVSHGPPRGRTPQAIDAATEAGNVGDGNINRLIEKAGIEFGTFGNIHEAGGKATDLTGENIVKQGEFTDSFYLNPGPSDSIRWMMNDGTESTGMAGLVTVRKDGQAAYWIYRAAPLTESEYAKAQKLSPPDEEVELGADDEDEDAEESTPPPPKKKGPE